MLKEWDDNAARVCPLSFGFKPPIGSEYCHCLETLCVVCARALFLAATDAELKRLLMELTTELLQEVQGRQVCSARIIGINDHAGGTDDTNTWVLSPTATISSSEILMQHENAPVLWLERPTSSSNTTNLLLSHWHAALSPPWIMEKHC